MTGWRSRLPESFWWTLLALLVLSAVAAIPLMVACALIWPNVGGSTATLMFVGCWLAAIPITWLLGRWADRS